MFDLVLYAVGAGFFFVMTDFCAVTMDYAEELDNRIVETTVKIVFAPAFAFFLLLTGIMLASCLTQAGLLYQSLGIS